MATKRTPQLATHPTPVDGPGHSTPWVILLSIILLSLCAQAATASSPAVVARAGGASGSHAGSTTPTSDARHSVSACRDERTRAHQAVKAAKHAKHGKAAKRAAAKKARQALKRCRMQERGKVPAPTKPAGTAAPTTTHASSASHVAAATTTVSPAASATTTVVRTAGTTEFRPLTGFFGPNSEWTRDVSSAPLAPDSSTLVQTVAGQVASKYAGTAAFNAYNYSRPFYTVAADTPTTTVQWNNCQGKATTPPSLYDPNYGANFVNVPIPAEAIPAAGTDGAMTVWQPSTDKLWEFWKAENRGGVWYACWGGRIDGWSQSPGYFTGAAGVSASGLSTASGSIGMEEAKAGQIDHAVALSLISTRNRAEYSYPAQRSDGGLPLGTVGAVAEGQRFRLDPSLDVTRLGLSPIATMIAKAAQKYGFVVVDRSGAVAVSAESSAGIVAAGGADPWATLMAGKPAYQIMANFPWGSLQALPWSYGQPTQ